MTDSLPKTSHCFYCESTCFCITTLMKKPSKYFIVCTNDACLYRGSALYEKQEDAIISHNFIYDCIQKVVNQTMSEWFIT